MGYWYEEGELIAGIIHDSPSIISVNDEEMFNVLSDFHIYCYGRLQQNEQLKREAAEIAFELQHILNMPLSPTNCSLIIKHEESNI